jgi:hypothetical protein
MKLVFTLLIAVFVAGYAVSDSDKHHKKYMKSDDIFKYLDANGDNKLSLEEFIGFAKMDKNNDKFISLEEFKDHHNSKNHDDDHHHFFKKH